MYSDENLEKILNQWLKEADEIEKEKKKKKTLKKNHNAGNIFCLMFLIVCIFSCRRGTHETKALCKCKVLLLYPKGAII